MQGMLACLQYVSLSKLVSRKSYLLYHALRVRVVRPCEVRRVVFLEALAPDCVLCVVLINAPEQETVIVIDAKFQSESTTASVDVCEQLVAQPRHLSQARLVRRNHLSVQPTYVSGFVFFHDWHYNSKLLVLLS